MVAFSLIYFVTLFDLFAFKMHQNVYFYSLLNIFIPCIDWFQCLDDNMMTQIARDEIKMGSGFMFNDI